MTEDRWLALGIAAVCIGAAYAAWLWAEMRRLNLLDDNRDD